MSVKTTPINYRNHPKMVDMFEPSHFIHAPYMFFTINGCIPNALCFFCYDKQLLFKLLITELSINEDDIIQVNKVKEEEDKYEIYNFLIPVKDNLLIHFNPDSQRIDLLYSPKTNKKLLDKVIGIIKTHLTVNPYLNKLFLLQEQSYADDIKSFDIVNNSISLEKNYNDDFIPIHNNILERLNSKNDKGLILLHGLPGTGKTSYIRYLTSVVNKRMIYISPEFAEKIGSPTFLSMISQYPNSIIVIEDAENIIGERKAGGNSAISNLLNLSDGLLSDCLKIQIICSFNTDISKVDKALMRKGRLIAKYNFGALCIEKSKQLSASLGFETIINKEMTLAEIFNQNDKEFNDADKKLGFVINEPLVTVE